MTKEYQNYQKTSITTASREQILIMLYEGAIRFTKQAKLALENKKIAKKGMFVSKATAIISELLATLDFKAGGKLAADLEGIYIFIIDSLIDANIKNDPKKFDSVVTILSTLLVAWKEIAQKNRSANIPTIPSVK